LPAPLPLTYTTLSESPLVRVQDYICRAGLSGPGSPEQSSENTIRAHERHGVFCKHFHGRQVTADLNHAIFFSRGAVVQVSHPADCGDRGTVFIVAPRVLNDIIRELDPSVDERPGNPFPFVTGPLRRERFLAASRPWCNGSRPRKTVPLEPLWADVTALQLTADVLEAAYAQAGVSPQPRRTATDRDHADRTEAAKRFLASSLGERITLDDVARAVHASPFHFTRIFQQRAGVPVHRYLTRLRLRAALERLAEGADDLTALALDLGFSSHSHFADAFRKEFGRTPLGRPSLGYPEDASADAQERGSLRSPGRRLSTTSRSEHSPMAMIEEGKKAPAFKLASSEGGDVSLKDLKGKIVVLYFYPKDDTPGCTREACAFRDTQASIKKAGAVVFGVSGDSLESHDKFQDEVQTQLPAAL
jgi:AraC family transcriptional regulator